MPNMPGLQLLAAPGGRYEESMLVNKNYFNGLLAILLTFPIFSGSVLLNKIPTKGVI